jgi:hypothetical protein
MAKGIKKDAEIVDGRKKKSRGMKMMKGLNS